MNEFDELFVINDLEEYNKNEADDYKDEGNADDDEDWDDYDDDDDPDIEDLAEERE